MTIVTGDIIETVFGLPCIILEDPISGTPLVIPKGRPITAKNNSKKKATN